MSEYRNLLHIHVAKCPADTISKVPQLGDQLADASAIQKATGQKQLVQIVVYDLPDRDCAAKASNGEFSIANNGQANYFSYIDALVAQISSALLVFFGFARAPLT